MSKLTSRGQARRDWSARYAVPIRSSVSNWHPIILEEMALNDFEHTRRPNSPASVAPADISCITTLVTEGVGEMFVPLLPMESGYRRDRMHSEQRGPRFLHVPAEAAVASEVYLG